MTDESVSDLAWIERLTDEQCMEIFWLYLESPDEFFSRHPPALLGHAMRYALKEIARGVARQRESS